MAKKTKSSRQIISENLAELHRELLAKRLKYHDAYQPIVMGDFRPTTVIRQSEDRLSLVKQGIEETGARNYLDIGCAEGYFVRVIGETGRFSLGIDIDRNRLGLVENARMIDGAPMSAFAFASATESVLESLPDFDAVSCFSLMHHIIRKGGVEHGRAILQKIRSRTAKVFFFDMGQYGESFPWADQLSFMGDDPEAWIVDFLHQAGFENVRNAGFTDAYKKEDRRILFECRI